MLVELTNQTDLKVDLAQLERAAAVVVNELNEQTDYEVSLVFVNEEEGAHLNETYRDRKGATDVLSFSFREIYESSQEGFRESENLLGEIVITAPIAQKQAKEAEHDADTEILILFIHGLLHLLGYDHVESEQEAQKMADAENLIYAKLDLPISANDRYKN